MLNESSEQPGSVALKFEYGLITSVLAAILQTVTQVLIFILFIMNFSRDSPSSDTC